MKRRRSWLAIMLVIFLGATLGVASGMYMALWLPSATATGTGLWPTMQPPFGGKRYVRIMMIGVDNTAGGKIDGAGGLSDTIVVFGVDTQTKEIRGISIPRDTRVEIPGHGIAKINSAHARGGPELTMRVLRNLLGVEIDYYIKTTVTGLVKLVDLAGGVYVVVDKNMRYNDRRGNLHIDLKASPEKQLLNGVQAMGYVRFRHDVHGDSGYTKDKATGTLIPAGRVVRQQYFFRSIANRIISMPTKRARARFLETAYKEKYMASNLNLFDWHALTDYAKDFEPEKIVMDVLPGGPGSKHGASYWLPDDEKISEVVARNLLFEAPAPGTAVDTIGVVAPIAASTGRPTPHPAETTKPNSTAPEAQIKVEVLNCSNRTGLARTVANQLRKAGYIVVNVGNTRMSHIERVSISSRKSESEQVKKLAKLLHCGNVTVSSAKLDSADVTITIGPELDMQALITSVNNPEMAQ